MLETILTIVLLAVPWSLFGILILILIADCNKTLKNCENSDFFNPLWIYNNYNVNWFGAVMLCLLFNILCPIWAIGFWFYKLCTVGRRNN